MSDVELTVKQIADALELSIITVQRWVSEDGKFPRAYMPYGSRRAGYRIPAADVLTLIQTENPRMASKIQRLIEDVERSQVA